MHNHTHSLTGDKLDHLGASDKKESKKHIMKYMSVNLALMWDKSTKSW